ncbi:MAG TPA: hypothetical protein VK084_08240 [Chitinophagaceae bacterium]|nr:hypothetical protein [Chitinophagaceae bacterium]
MSKVKTHFKRYHKHYLLTVLSIIILIVIASWVVVRHYRPILSEKLKQQVYLASDSLYRVDYSAVHLKPIRGIFSLDSFRLIPNKVVYRKLKKAHRAPDQLFSLSVKKFELQHIHLWALLRKKEAQIEVIKVENPEISVYQLPDREDESVDKQTVREGIAQLISGSLKSIKIGHIGLHNIKFSYVDSSNHKLNDLDLRKMDLVFENVFIDSSTLEDSTRFLFSKRSWFYLKKLRFNIQDSLYTIDLNGIGVSINEGKLTIDSLAVHPRLSEENFAKQFIYRKDVFRGKMSRITINGFDIADISKRDYSFNKVKVSQFKLNIFLNRRPPLNPKRKPMLQEALAKIIRPIYVKKLALKNGFIKYSELNPNSGQVGNVVFNQIHGDIENITNDSVRIKKNPHLIADLQTRFMDAGDLNVHWDFNLRSPQHDFIYEGKLTNLKASALNPATKPLGLIRVKSGRIHALDFHFSANHRQSVGKVKMKYDRLKIAVLSHDEQKNELKKKGLASLAANLLLIRESNMPGAGVPQSTQVVFARKPQRSIFSYMWKSIFKGVKPLVGIDQKTEDKLKEMLAKWKEKKKDSLGKNKEKSSLKMTFKEITKFIDKNL